MRRTTRVYLVSAALFYCACAPHARIPPQPRPFSSQLSDDDPAAILARSLAPLVYLQRDEPFALERVVAVVHPTRKVIAYHLLWRDDAHGGWLSFTMPTDHEIIWVGYDSTLAPTDLWTYWHGTILHAKWNGRGQALVDVQWGKHGSLPSATRPTDLPWTKSHDMYYLLAWMLPDLWLGNLARKGPWCFCHGYIRYTSFTEPIQLAPRIALVARDENPAESLRAFSEIDTRRRSLGRRPPSPPAKTNRLTEAPKFGQDGPPCPVVFAQRGV